MLLRRPGGIARLAGRDPAKQSLYKVDREIEQARIAVSNTENATLADQSHR